MDHTTIASNLSESNAAAMISRSGGSLATLEMLTWIVAPLLLCLPEIIYRPHDQPGIFPLTLRYSDYIVLALAVPFFPIIFKLIFSAYPFEAARIAVQRRSEKAKIHRQFINDIATDHLPIADSKASKPSPPSAPTNFALIGGEEESSSSLLYDYCINSRALAHKLYTRAGVYLLIGVMIAFSGLVFFYLQTPPHADPGSGTHELMVYASKFGILFFIEMVALFFLRQYRSAMEEFRYYEAVARRREELKLLAFIAKDGDAKFDPMALLGSGEFFSRAAVPKEGSGNIADNAGLGRNEIDLLGKLIDALAQNKK